MPFVIGETIGQYRLVEQLGQGGMATVFKGYHSRLERYVAIKALHPAFTEDENFLARFNREAKVVANLDHPNIVPIYDFSEHEGRPYLVMKYIEGETLKARLTANPMPLEETLRIVEKAGEALAYAHNQGVLHRDIKPSNVLLTSDGQIYLADFGLARIAAAGESSLTADRMVGTPQYMSPEQAVAKSDLDQRSDIYSFGVMLYEMVVGRVPFNADTPFAIIHDHIYTPLPLPRVVNPDVSEAVQRVLLKALAKEPQDRYATMQDLMSALRKAVREQVSPELTAGADGSTRLAFAGVADMIPEAVPQGENPEEISQATEVLEQEPQGKGPRKGKAAKKSRKSNTPKEPGKLKQRWQSTRKGWRIFWIISSLLLVGFCCLLTIGIIEEERQQAQTAIQLEGMLDNPLPDTGAPPVSKEALDEAYAALDAALEHWRNGDLGGLMGEIDHMKGAAGNDNGFYEDAFQMMADEKAWLPLVVTVRDWPMERLEPFKEEARMVFYLAARDPLSGPIWEELGDHPYALIARLRHELYFGDPQMAKNKLGNILQDEGLVMEYPEARVLEAEIYVHNGDFDRARLVIRDVIRNNEIPGWLGDVIKNITLEYNMTIPLPQNGE